MDQVSVYDEPALPAVTPNTWQAATVTTQRPPLKDQLFGPERVTSLADRLQLVYPALPYRSFVDEMVGRLDELELKQRISWIAELLERYLPEDYREAVEVLLRSLPQPCDPNLSDGDFGDFIFAPYAEFVARRGTAPADLDYSLAALKEITTRFSAEYAIRTFIDAYPEHTMAVLLDWTHDPHYHVRRLTSEGTRPRLPWARRLSLPVTAGIPILDNLYADPTRFVTRSVANHLNDIAKTDPDLVTATLERWKAGGRANARELDWIVRHATRTLVKAGHRPTLGLLGISTDDHVMLTDLDASPTVELGGFLDLSLTVRADQKATVVIDYALRFAGSNGQPGGRKVFKLRRLTLAAGQSITLAKRHRLRAGMTTRTIHPGGHVVEVLINGTAVANRHFTVLP